MNKLTINKKSPRNKMSELEPTSTPSDKSAGDGEYFVFDDTEFDYDDAAGGIDDDGNWVEYNISSLASSTENSQGEESKFGDKPALFAEYVIAGIHPKDITDDLEESALYGEWLDSLDENTRLIIDERKRAEERHEVIKGEILKSSPSLLEGRLPPDQVRQLGSEKYVLGVNQSMAFTVDEAQAYLREDNGIGLGIYGLGQRFLLLDEKSTAVDSEYTKRVIASGYYQNSDIGRFIIAIPMDRREQYNAPQDAISEADAIIDFTQPTSETGGRSVSPKYLAGFIDEKGKYHKNRNFGQSTEPLFD